MTTLEQRQAQARLIANKRGVPICIYNFNPHNPHYVMREYDAKEAETSRYFVSIHYPQGPAAVYVAGRWISSTD